MNGFRLIAICLLGASLCLAVSKSVDAQSLSADAPCSVSNGIARITPHGMSDVREVTAVAPDGGVVYLYSPKLGVHNLKFLRSGTIEIDPHSQLGSQYAEDGELHQRASFSDEGSYRLVVLGKASKAAKNVLYTRIGCALDFAESAGFKRALPLAGLAKNPIASALDCPAGKEASVLSRCRDSPGCETSGNGYCCSYSGGTGGPCFCNNCCVAKASTQSR